MCAQARCCLIALLVLAMPLAADEVRTKDGLTLRLSKGGAVEGIESDETVFQPVAGAKPIFRIREFKTEKWSDLVGVVEGTRQRAEAADLGLALEAEYRVAPDRIEIDGAVIDRRAEERSVELMVALPAKAAHGRWHLDIVESVDIAAAKAGAAARPTQAPAPAAGPYSLWIDAHDCDPEMCLVSVVGADGTARPLALLAGPDSATLVDQKWRTFVVPGIQESDFVDGRLRVRIENLRGGPVLMQVGGVYVMDAQRVRMGEADADALMAKSDEEVQKLSLASWVYAPAHRPKKEKVWFFERKSILLHDACRLDFILPRGEHRMGDAAGVIFGYPPIVPDAEGALPSLNYPWATVAQREAGGYTLAVSPEMPCLYRFQYDVASDEVQLVLSYGLSVHPKSPELKSRAPFRLVLYRTDDAWGFREAAQRYQALAPDLFKRRTDRFGYWYGAGPYVNYRGLAGEFAYLEVHEGRLYPRQFLKDRLAWEEWKERLGEYFPRHKELGILVLPYRHFYHCSLHVKGDMDGTLPHMPKTYKEAMTMLETLPIPFGNGYGHHLRKVIQSSTMRRKNGKLDVKLSADDACAPTGRLIYRTTISPYLYDDKPEVMTNARMEREFAEALLKSFPDVGGIYYDAGAGGGGVTYAPEHLRYARSPLVPGPGMSRIAGKYEFGRWMGDFLHKHGKVDFVNGGAGMSPRQTWHILPFDCIGVEWPPVLGGERKLRFLRTLAGDKPVSFLIFKMAGDVAAAYDTYVGKLGIYGIFPPPRVKNMSGRSRNVTELAAPYALLLQKMYRAGWEPVTHARCANTDLCVERYGPADGRVYIALFNPTLSTVETDLTIDAKAMGLPRLTKAAAYFTDRKEPALTPAGEGRYGVSVRVPSMEFVVVEAGERDVDDPDRVTGYYPALFRACEAESAKPRLVGEWLFDEGRGQVAKDTSGTDAHAALGKKRKPDDSDPQWSTDGHTGGALLFDGKDDIAIVRDPGRLGIQKTFTIEAWIKRTRRTTHARVIDLPSACIYFKGDGDEPGMRISGYSANTAWGTPIPLDEWTQLKATYDGKTIRFYVNGTLCGSKDYPCDTPIAGRALCLGNLLGLNRPFAGLIDEVRVHNYVK